MAAKRLIFIFCAIGLNTLTLQAQDPAEFREPESGMWLGTFGKFQIAEKLYWDAQFHYRTAGYDGTPYVGRIAQLYNRHGLTYRFRPNFLFTIGGVLRLDFTPNPGNQAFEPVQAEPRIWHEYLWSIPYKRAIVYHRIRIEHRWNKLATIDSDWFFTNRWRYKVYIVMPLNRPTLNSKTWFIAPEVELIMRNGKHVGGSPMEDLRLFPHVGYVLNARLKYTFGMMYSFGQSLQQPFEYRQRWILRANVFISLDFRKTQDKIPEIRIFD
jgi:hypothetical protein